jgi:hypothetical protein
MKLTTKILLYIILSIFFISIAIIIGFSFSGKQDFSFSVQHHIKIPETGMAIIEVEPYTVVVIDKKLSDSEMNFVVSQQENNWLNVSPASNSAEENQLLLPEGFRNFISVATVNDTLTVTLNADSLLEVYNREVKHYAFLSDFNLVLHPSKVDIINRLYHLPIEVSDFETDIMKIKNNGNIFIKGCNVQIFEPIVSGELEISDSKINSLNLDLDHIHAWDFANSEIETLNFTGGSNISRAILSKGDVKKVNWLPKNKSAKLQIEIPGDTTQIWLQ